MKIRLVRVEKNFDFPFPGDTEHCPSALFFKVGLGDDEKFNMVVGYTTREAHGMVNRRRIHIGLEIGASYRSLVQFEGSDDYAQTGDCVCVLKHPDSNQWISTSEAVPAVYAGHHIVIFERFIKKGGGDHWGILVNEGEIDDMLRVGFVRATHKGLK